MSSILVNRYGSRPVVMVGGVMVCTAMVLASFGTTIIHLYLCVGVIGGTFIFILSLMNIQFPIGNVVSDFWTTLYVVSCQQASKISLNVSHFHK